MPVHDTEQMSDVDLIKNVETLSTDAVTFNAEFMAENTNLFDRYVGNPYGDEEPDRSKVTTTDVEDTVNSYMVSLARVFLGPDPVIEVMPRNPEDEDQVEEARQKTIYADWLIRKQNTSYKTQYSTLFEILLMKFGASKYFAEEKVEIVEEHYSAIDEVELAGYMESLEGEDVESVEIESKSDDFNGVDKIDFTFKVKRKFRQITITSIPPECLIISKDAEDKNTAPIVGDDTPITRGELVEMGYEKKEIAKMPQWNKDKNQNTNLDERRNQEEGSDSQPWFSPTWASEQVKLSTRYALIDFDGDGIAERRYILYSGEVLLENERFDHVPYAIGSSLLMPHRAIGRSVGEQAAPYNLQNTTLLRGLFDNAYSVNKPRIAHNEDVNQDDLLDQEHGSTIRIRGKQPPINSILAIETPYIGDKMLQILQFQFQRRAQSTGSTTVSQGLESDDFNEESATRFTGVQEEGQGKVELVARNIAETYFKDLYEGVLWIAAHFNLSEQEIRVTGETLKVNPNDWKFGHDLDVKVGLGSGDEDHVVESMSAILNLTNQLEASGSPLVDQEKKYNTIKSLLGGLGISNIQKHFNDPTKPKELLRAENDINSKVIAQLQEQVQALQNPLLEPEKIRAEAKLIEAQGKAQIEIAKEFEKQRQFNEELRLDYAQLAEEIRSNDQDTATDLTKLELENKKNVEGSLV